jgi:hypothetical protein
MSSEQGKSASRSRRGDAGFIGRLLIPRLVARSESVVCFDINVAGRSD